MPTRPAVHTARCPAARSSGLPVKLQVVGQRVLIELERHQRSVRLLAIKSLVAERRSATMRLEAEAATLVKAERAQQALADAILHGEPAPRGM